MPRFALAVPLLALVPLAAQSPRPVDFQREVRPILSENCFHCHGPDKNTRMAGLRLDTREGAFSVRPGGSVIAPGNTRASLLYQRIASDKDAMRMPPVFTKKALTDQQKGVLKRWIEQGAAWKEHWSFQAPVRPAAPRVVAKEWPRNPIDTFILAKLEAARLKPAPEADRRRLIRRVSLDLTGLPPSTADIEAFVGDKSGDAYEKVVDRLLASPRFGEHRARYWLDAARYADTHGIHIDNYREMWPYRDWVIQAFNRNLSFDRFTVEQLAGDLLPNPTMEQQIATGFHRCNTTTNEGGSIVEEVAAMYAKDRVETTGTVWLGLTVGCRKSSTSSRPFSAIRRRSRWTATFPTRRLSSSCQPKKMRPAGRRCGPRLPTPGIARASIVTPPANHSRPGSRRSRNFSVLWTPRRNGSRSQRPTRRQ